MAVVWQNSFDGEPLTLVSEDLAGPGTSGEWGDPIVDLRNSADVSHVRYGDQAYGGRSSLMLGADDAFSGNHGDVQLTQPVGEWSVSFYLYRTDDGWVRFLQSDRVNVNDLYLDYATNAHFVGWTELDTAATDQMHDRWVRCEASQGSDEVTWRFWWTDPDSTGEPDYEITVESTSTSGYLFVQGGGSEADHPPAYIDQVRVGEGEWLGPWPTHQTFAAQASLGLTSAAQIRADLTGDGVVAVATLPLSSSARITRVGRMDASADLPVDAASTITRHATVDAAADLDELEASAQITRAGRFTASADLGGLAASAQLRSQFRPTFPPRLTTELLLDGGWVDISGDVRAEEPVQITRGRADEASQADPSSCGLTLDNRGGKYSPHNPLSPYYGQIGKNTPLRVRVGPLPEEGATVLADGFGRTVTGGWGEADSGHVWEPAAGPDSSYSVEDGAGRIALDSPGDPRAVHTDADLTDFDVTCAVALDTTPRGEAVGATYLSLAGRTTDPGGSSESGYRLSVGWRVDAGRGPHVVPEISRMDDGSNSSLTPVRAPVPGMTYLPGDWLRVRAQAVGPELRIRVWPDGEREPDVWHAQAHDRRYEQGAFGVRGNITPGAYATDPTVISVRNLHVRTLWEAEEPHVVRFTGEVSSWPSRWDVADVDVTAPVEASGLLRRLGQGSKPIRSVTRRAIPSFLPVAYWPMEEGRTARFANSPTPGVEPMRVTGLHFAEDDSLGASRPLPTVGDSGATMTAPIPYVEALGWEVHALVHFPDEPEITPWASSDEPNQTDFISIDSTEIRATMDFINTGDEDDPNVLMRWRLFSPDGDEIAGTQTNASALWGGWRRIAFRAAPDGSSTEMSILRTFVEVGTSVANLVVPQSYSGPVGSPAAIMATIGPELEGLAIGHVVVWGSANVFHYMDASAGWDGETARFRLSRMSTDFDVPILISGAADERLGPEEEGTFLDVVGQAMEADLGSPGEDRASLSLTYTGRDQMYNAEPALILDYAGGEISPPMEPEDDDQALRNDVEVQRSDGIAVQVEDSDGPVGVSRVGRYDESVTLSLATDSQVDDQAGWRLHLGTVDGLRFPVIHLNLANPRLSARIEDVLALDAGDRVRILNPPPWTQERALDLVVQGYEEHIGLFQWEITLTCTPASPWQVGQIGEEEVEAPPDAPMRADTAGCVLADALDETETEVRVRTTRGPAWVTSEDNPACLPFDITIAGEVMRVLASDDEADDDIQRFTVERSTTGVVKPHEAGTAVWLAYPATAAL